MYYVLCDIFDVIFLMWDFGCDIFNQPAADKCLMNKWSGLTNIHYTL